MVKDLKVWKKNIATATTAMVIATIAMTGCSKEKIEPEETYDTVYYTTYDEYGQNYVWQEISKEDYQNMDDSIIAETQQEDTTLYAASYQSLGYMAAQKNETKQEAVTNNPKYKDNSQFLAGFDLGKQDKYERKAKEEQKQYVAIKQTAEPTSSMDETEYYPVEDLTVVSYNGANALVTDYNEDAVKTGNYEDLLGKDMSSYYENFLQKFPCCEEAYVEYGIYLCRLGRWKEAQTIYRRGKNKTSMAGEKAGELKEKLGI